MSDVEFEEEDTLLAQAPRQMENVPTLCKILIKTGLIKTVAQANIVLAIIGIGAFALSIYVFLNFVLL